MAFGILMGALPGLTAPMAMALLLGFVYTLPTDVSIVAMVMIFIGGVYGGSMSAIVLNIPGAPASAATALDGHPLAQRGRAGEVIGLCTVSSGVGSFMGAVLMALLTPWLVKFSLQFASWELLFLVLFGIIIAGSLAAEDPINGWISGFIGLLIAMVGFDDLHSVPRFTFDSSYLAGGIGLIAAIVGLFGISQVVISMGPRESGQRFVTQSLKPGPTFLIDNLDLFNYLVASLLIGAVLLVVVGLTLARGMINILRVPREHIMAVVIALAAIGAYASKLQFNDLWMMLCFGAIGLAMRSFGFSLAPLTLGIVLGRPLDEYLRNALVISQGDLTEIFNRPIATGLLMLIVFFILVRIPMFRRCIAADFDDHGSGHGPPGIDPEDRR